LHVVDVDPASRGGRRNVGLVLVTPLSSSILRPRTLPPKSSMARRAAITDPSPVTSEFELD
jgi:hypothetical protein